MSATLDLRDCLLAGQVIPAHPLALTAGRKLDERYQRALTRYYVSAGAGGIAVGVHTTQFAIRDAQHALFKPVLELASETVDAALAPVHASIRAIIAPSPLPEEARGESVHSPSPFQGEGWGEGGSQRLDQDFYANAPGRASRPFVKVAGICGWTAQAVAEAELARELGYHVGLLSPGAWKDAADVEILAHCRRVADVLPLMGFYLQPAVGGRPLPYSFWRQFAEIENVVAIKIAPFNRYQTLDVIRAVAESGREDIALYTGNDDTIVVDLLTNFEFSANKRQVSRRIVGGLLGHWAVWTRRAVETLERIKQVRRESRLDPGWLTTAARITEMNAALFDAANGFAGCIAGIHEVLRRQGLMQGLWCLDAHEGLSPGQQGEIDRVLTAYPGLQDDAFVAEHRDAWLR